MKKEELKKVYETPSEKFHERVVSTLDSLDAAPVMRLHRTKLKRIAIACAAAAVLAAFTVTAAATNMFGLTAERRGTYGLNVKVENSDTDTAEYQPMKLKLGYLPKAYESGKSDRLCFTFEDNSIDTYFNANLYYTDHFDYDYTNVVKTEEAEIDGHKTLIITFKEAENTDKLFYATLKYFDEYHCLVRCNGTDYDELMKITENAEVEPDLESVTPTDVSEGMDYSSTGALSDYAKGEEGFRDEYFAGRVHEAKIGESVDLSVADYEQKAVQVKIKVKSIKEQDNADGLEVSDFIEIDYSKYFDAAGNLIKQKTTTMYEGADDDHLGIASNVTFTRHFYVADIELTAQEDIDDLYNAFGIDVYGIDVENNFFYGLSTTDNEYVLKIYGTKAGKKLSVKKGEKLSIKIGFIAENDTADDTYIAISAIDEPKGNYQNYMIKVKE